MRKKCTAIVVSNNSIALETLKYLNIHHLQVGTDVELLGFSGSDWYGYRTEKSNRQFPTTRNGRNGWSAAAGTNTTAQSLRTHHCSAQHLYPKKQIKELPHV